MHSAFVHFESSDVHYSYTGHGSKILVCLHGYGETGNSFYFLEPHLPGFLIIGIDMPYCGKTQWKEGLEFTATDLLQIIDSILARHHVSGASYSLLGFSMGGRVALTLLQHVPERIEKMVLLAPDGLKVNFWYWLATHTRAGNRLFRYTMKHPQWLFFTMRAGRAIGMMNKSIYRFALHYIHDKKMRKLLFFRWTCMRPFRPGLAAIKKGILQNHIPIHIVFGEYDRIFTRQRGEKFRKGIESFCTLHTAKTGHQVLQPRNAALIAGLL